MFWRNRAPADLGFVSSELINSAIPANHLNGSFSLIPAGVNFTIGATGSVGASTWRLIGGVFSLIYVGRADELAGTIDYGEYIDNVNATPY